MPSSQLSLLQFCSSFIYSFLSEIHEEHNTKKIAYIRWASPCPFDIKLLYDLNVNSTFPLTILHTRSKANTVCVKLGTDESTAAVM